ncbi:MAG: GNAT family N-acetyltransferase, partial [Actinomycetes bacterium]
MTGAGPVLRTAGCDEDAAIRRVLAEAFSDNPKARAEMTRWQYWENPFGESVTWVQEDAGEVVAVYTGIPVPVVLGQRRDLAALAIDVGVAPSHQGRRLYTPLARALYEDLGRHGMTYTLAYPSTASVRGMARAGWKQISQLRVNVLPLSDDWLAKRFHAPVPVARLCRQSVFHVPGSAAGQRVREVPEGIDQLWKQHSARFSESGVIRDAAWWRWRYGGNPDRPYRYYETGPVGAPSGAAVTRTVEAFGGRFAYVLELLATEAASTRALVRAIVEDHTGDDGAGAVGTPGDGTPGDGAGADGVALITLAGSAMDRMSRA